MHIDRTSGSRNGWRLLGIAVLVGAIGMAGGLAGRQLGEPATQISGGQAAAPLPGAIPAAGPNLTAPAAPDSVYRSMTPCRIVDTRYGGTILTANTVRSFAVRGSTGFPSQGGKTGGCAIPAAATAITASLTATAPAAAGYLHAWPTGQTEPNATLLNYGTSSATAGQVVPLAAASPTPLTVKNYAGTTHLIVDVTGYYVPAIEAFIQPDSTIGSSTSRVVSSTRVSTGIDRVGIDGSIDGCSVNATPYATGFLYAAAYTSGTSVIVYTWYLDNTGHVVQANLGFYLQVLC